MRNLRIELSECGNLHYEELDYLREKMSFNYPYKQRFLKRRTKFVPLTFKLYITLNIFGDLAIAIKQRRMRYYRAKRAAVFETLAYDDLAS